MANYTYKGISILPIGGISNGSIAGWPGYFVSSSSLTWLAMSSSLSDIALCVIHVVGWHH